MKRGCLLNSRVTSVISEMGHTDCLTIGDAGLPVPAGTERIDLAVRAGLPAFDEVFSAVMTELCIEKVVIAEEIKTENPGQLERIEKAVADYCREMGWGVQLEFVPHEDFKKISSSSRAVVRTGEVSPYANIHLFSGVVF